MDKYGSTGAKPKDGNNNESWCREQPKGESRPRNTTRTETVKGKVIVVQPIGDDIEVQKYIRDPVKVSNAIEESEFGSVELEEVITNPRRGTVTVVVKDREAVEGLLKVDKLGIWKVRCFQPVTHTTVYGVIGPIAEDNTEEQVKWGVDRRVEQRNFSVARLYKGRGRNRMPTKCIKIGIPGQQLPEHIYVGYIRYQVKPYVEAPYQCYRCQGFGHGAAMCTARLEKCVICAGNHRMSECPKEQIRCANCDSTEHTAGYGGCPKMVEARQIEKIKAEEA